MWQGRGNDIPDKTRLDSPDLETLTGEDIERAAERLYGVMEGLSDDPPGEPWEDLPEAYKPWYRKCAAAVLGSKARGGLGQGFPMATT